MNRLRHKYRVSPPERRQMDGITFDSKKEMARYAQLKVLREQGEVVQFLVQTPTFRFEGGSRYTADFLVFWTDGRVTIEDVKGHRTDAYKRAKRMVEAKWPPLVITEV